MLQAVIFDLDGTIGDTLPICIQSFRQAVEPLTGRRLSDQEIIREFGPSEEGTLRRMVPEHYDRALESFLEHYRENHRTCTEPFEGIRTLLEDLKKSGKKVGLVTGKGAQSCEITLEQFGLEGVFDAVDTGSPEGNRKAEAIRRMLGYFAVSPEDAVYVGDAPSDVTESRKAGIPVISAVWADTADMDAITRVQPDAIAADVGSLRKFLDLDR